MMGRAPWPALPACLLLTLLLAAQLVAARAGFKLPTVYRPPFPDHVHGGAGEGEDMAHVKQMPNFQSEAYDGDGLAVLGYRWLTEAQYQLLQRNGQLLDGPPAESKDQKGKEHTIGYALYLGSKADVFGRDPGRVWACAVYGPVRAFLEEVKLYIPFKALFRQNRRENRSKWEWKYIYFTDWALGLLNNDRTSFIARYIQLAMDELYGERYSVEKAAETIRFSQYKPTRNGPPVPDFLQLAIPPEKFYLIDTANIVCSRDYRVVDKGPVNYYELLGFNTYKSYYYGRALENS